MVSSPLLGEVGANIGAEHDPAFVHLLDPHAEELRDPRTVDGAALKRPHGFEPTHGRIDMRRRHWLTHAHRRTSGHPARSTVHEGPHWRSRDCIVDGNLWVVLHIYK